MNYRGSTPAALLLLLLLLLPLLLLCCNISARQNFDTPAVQYSSHQLLAFIINVRSWILVRLVTETFPPIPKYNMDNFTVLVK
jgi:hypothetical protein